MSKMRKVDDFMEGTPNYLTTIFDQGTPYQGDNFFTDIYYPVKIVTSTGIADDFSYVNVGFTPDEIADIYWTKYSGNYLIGAGEHKTIEQDVAKILYRVQSTYFNNLGKYLKLKELLGYEYNPLWNVDGTEVHQELENQGVNDVESGGITSNIENDFTALNSSENISAFNNEGYRPKTQNLTSGSQGGGIGLPGQTVTYDSEDDTYNVGDYSAPSNNSASSHTTNGTKSSVKYIHKNAKNLVYNTVTSQWEEADYVVNPKDTAFGTAVTGGDKMRIEKLIRQGNIGVTKTTELIRDQMDILKFNLLQEFFDDINQVILVGLYGEYNCI